MVSFKCIERLMNKYWWESNGNRGGGIRWMAWNRMCGPKSEGGLGFKSLSRFNVALLAKQGWRLLTNLSSLAARLYKARYFPHVDFLDAKIGANPQLLLALNFSRARSVASGCFQRIGDGRNTCIWNQPWLPDEGDPFIHTHDQNMKDFDDKWCWRGDIRGSYSVKLGFRALTDLQGHGQNVNEQWKFIWQLKVPPSVKYFLWRCMHQIIPTLTTLFSRRVEVDVMCPLCLQQPETLNHLIRECAYVIPLWQELHVALLPNDELDFGAWLRGIITQGDEISRLHIISLCWIIWRWRNEVVWSHIEWNHMAIKLEVQRTVGAWQQLNQMSHTGIAMIIFW